MTNNSRKIMVLLSIVALGVSSYDGTNTECTSHQEKVRPESTAHRFSEDERSSGGAAMNTLTKREIRRSTK